MKIVHCVDCGQEFEQTNSTQIRCPLCQKFRIRELQNICTKNARKKEYEKDKICIVCGSIFHSEKKNVTHCSKKCVGVTRRKAKEDNKLKGKATKKAKGMTITEIAVAARKENLTYGQYVIKYGL